MQKTHTAYFTISSITGKNNCGANEILRRFRDGERN